MVYHYHNAISFIMRSAPTADYPPPPITSLWSGSLRGDIASDDFADDRFVVDGEVWLRYLQCRPLINLFASAMPAPSFRLRSTHCRAALFRQAALSTTTRRLRRKLERALATMSIEPSLLLSASYRAARRSPGAVTPSRLRSEVMAGATPRTNWRRACWRRPPRPRRYLRTNRGSRGCSGQRWRCPAPYRGTQQSVHLHSQNSSRPTARDTTPSGRL